jgi:hypothetical protein
VQWRLHRGGRFRSWLGARFGGDRELGDRLWRRILHGLGALVVLYYVLPSRLFVVVSTEEVILALLALVLLLEAARQLGALELPTVRPFEKDRVASFAYYSIALVAAVLVFPEPIGATVAVGTALVDPLIGELRGSARFRSYYPGLPITLYTIIGLGAFLATTTRDYDSSLLLAFAAALVAVAAERPKNRWVDDDLLMTIAPALLLLALVTLWPA